MFSFVTLAFTVLSVKGAAVTGVITSEQDMGFTYSQTSAGASAGLCGYAIGTNAQRRPSRGIRGGGPQLLQLPLSLLALDVCQQDNVAVEFLQTLDAANVYQCVEGNTELDRLVYVEQGSIGDCRNDERLDFTEEDVDTSYSCNSNDQICAAEIEFEEYANSNCQGLDASDPSKPDRDLRIRVALDTCIPVTEGGVTDSYQYRCGLDSSGNPCNTDSSDDCTSSVALYRFDGVSDCSGTANFQIGFISDPDTVCRNAPNGIPFRYYRVEVDCPFQL